MSEQISIQMTVLFQDPFWIAVMERTQGQKYEACKVTFGPEPKDYEVQKFMLQHGYELRFSPPVTETTKTSKRVNPKRMQRKIKKEMSETGVQKKAWNAINLAREENKVLKKEHNKQRIEEEKERLFQLRQEKKKEKHRGR